MITQETRKSKAMKSGKEINIAVKEINIQVNASQLEKLLYIIKTTELPKRE